MTKKTICKAVSLAAAVAATAGMSLAAGAGTTLTADQALQKLMGGNQNYVESRLGTYASTTTYAREKLARSQQPYAIILSCSDSRVPPELIFDKSLGEIFVVRVAGNIPDPIVLGSVEYAAEHLGSPLIMVLGHERCGAVKATVDAKGKPEGNIGAIVKEILPCANQAKAAARGKTGEEVVEHAVEINARTVAENLTKRSKVLAHLAHEGKIKIVSAKYDLDDGKVTLLK